MRKSILLLLSLLLVTSVGLADHPVLKLDTVESSTGFTWTDDSLVYSKVISLGACPNATTKTVAHGVAAGIDVVLPISGVFREGATGVVAPFSQAISGGAYDYWEIDTAISGLITIGSNVDRSASTCTAVLYYTKP